MPRYFPHSLVPLALLVLTGCAGETAVSGGPPTQSTAPEPMAGRWQLAAPGLSQCVMTFGGAPDVAEGTIQPQGGCPGSFYTSRKWTFESGSLVIRDHKGVPLGQLSLAAPGRFEGKATNEQALTLAR